MRPDAELVRVSFEDQRGQAMNAFGRFLVVFSDNLLTGCVAALAIIAAVPTAVRTFFVL